MKDKIRDLIFEYECEITKIEELLSQYKKYNSDLHIDLIKNLNMRIGIYSKFTRELRELL